MTTNILELARAAKALATATAPESAVDKLADPLAALGRAVREQVLREGETPTDKAIRGSAQRTGYGEGDRMTPAQREEMDYLTGKELAPGEGEAYGVGRTIGRIADLPNTIREVIGAKISQTGRDAAAGTLQVSVGPVPVSPRFGIPYGKEIGLGLQALGQGLMRGDAQQQAANIAADALANLPKSKSAEGFKPGTVKWWTENLAEQIPYLAMTIATGGAAAGLGAGQAATTMIATIPTLGIEAQEAFQTIADALEKQGMPRDQAMASAAPYAMTVGLVNGALEAVPASEFLFNSPMGNALKRRMSHAITKRLAGGISGGTAEGVTEIAQELSQMVGQFAATQDVAAFDNALERFAAAGTLGAGGGTIMGLALSPAEQQALNTQSPPAGATESGASQSGAEPRASEQPGSASPMATAGESGSAAGTPPTSSEVSDAGAPPSSISPGDAPKPVQSASDEDTEPGTESQPLSPKLQKMADDAMAAAKKALEERGGVLDQGNAQGSVSAEGQAPAAQDETEAFVQGSLNNLTKLSRTANGVIDVSSTKGKADQMAVTSGDEAKDKARGNFTGTMRWLAKQKDRSFVHVQEVLDWMNEINDRLNQGITKAGTRYRTGESKMYRPTSEIERGMFDFAEWLRDSLRDPKADPIEIAAAVHNRLNFTLHPWADGVGKTAQAIADYVLYRGGKPLPRVATRDEWYHEASHASRRGAEGALHWSKYFRSLVEPKESPKAFGAKLNAEQKEARDRLMARLDGMTQEEFEAEYAKIEESVDGKVIGSDIARFLLPEYGTREGRIRFTPSTGVVSKWVKRMLVRKLQNPPKFADGRAPRLVVTAGGVAAGKSTATKDLVNDADLVWDTTLRGFDEDMGFLRMALDAGWEIHVAYVHRPFEMIPSGAMERAQTSGRWGPVRELHDVHRDAQRSFTYIREKLESDPRVTFVAFKSTTTFKKPVPTEVIDPKDVAPEGRYYYSTKDKATHERIVEQALEEARNSGEYDPRLLEAFDTGALPDAEAGDGGLAAESQRANQEEPGYGPDTGPQVLNPLEGQPVEEILDLRSIDDPKKRREALDDAGIVDWDEEAWSGDIAALHAAPSEPDTANSAGAEPTTGNGRKRRPSRGEIGDSGADAARPKLQTRIPKQHTTPLGIAGFLLQRKKVLENDLKGARLAFDMAYDSAMNDPGKMQRAEDRVREVEQELQALAEDQAAVEKWGDSLAKKDRKFIDDHIIIGVVGREPKPATPAPAATGIRAALSPEKQALLAELEKQLAAKLNTELRSGIDPEMLTLATRVGALYIEAGARTFATWAKEMAKRYGDAIKPYLKGVYLSAKNMPGTDSQGMTGAAEVETANLDAILAGDGDVQGTGSEEGQSAPGPVGTPGDQGTDAAAPGSTGGVEGGGGTDRVGGGEADADGGNAGNAGQPGSAPTGSGGNGVPGRSAGSRRKGREPRRADKPGTGDPGNVTPPPALTGNWIITDPDDLERSVSKRTKARENVDAIETAKKVLVEGRRATADEQAIIAKFRGWGDLPGMFIEYGAQAEELKEQRTRLRDLLTDEEWEAAKASTTNAHYTSAGVVNAMWRAVQRMGIQHGANGRTRILEPGFGIGHFYGLMPAGLRDSALNAVELDSWSARMAQLLYPNAKVIEGGFQESGLPDNFYDLVISNVPFSATVRITSDRRYAKTAPLLHDYYFLKSLDLTRPGGIVAFITSSATMDQEENQVRHQIAEKADFLGAIRLPTMAFDKVAGTQVVTDIIFLQKRMADKGEKHAAPWFETGMQKVEGKDDVRVNEYFLDNPEQVMGTIDRSGKGFAKDSKGVTEAEDWQRLLDEAIDRLPTAIVPERGAKIEAEAIPADKSVRDGGYVFDDAGNLTQRVGNEMHPVKAGKERLEKIKGLLGVRDAMREVLDLEIAGASDEQLKPARKALNKAYDAFTKKHGNLRDKPNIDAIRGDPDSPVLQALELPGKKKGTFAKADIFRQRVIRQPMPVSTTDDVKAAIGLVLNEKGHLDMNRLAEITAKELPALQGELAAKGMAFESPDGGWQTAEQYLSGNVKAKLQQAQAAAKLDPRFEPNVRALEKVIPEDIPVTRIHVRMGVPWVHEDDYRAFLTEVGGMRADQVDIARIPQTNKWVVRVPSYANVAAFQTSRASFADVIEAAMGNTSITIKDLVERNPDRYEVNQKETELANAAVRALEQTFKVWLWRDDARRARLHRVFNDTMNTTVNVKPSGAHLTFPGMNPAFDLHAHNRDVAWQIITNGRLLMAHEVGTGKTMGMAAGAMELRRLGLANKVCIACPKATALQTTKEIRDLYPGAKIFSTAEGGANAFDAKNRKRAVSQIATGDWDIVIVTHEHLNYLPLQGEAQVEYMRREVRELEMMLTVRYQARSGGAGTRAQKAIENRLAKLREKINTILAAKHDDAVTFEETGIDFLMVDEAHKYKALPITTQQENVKGIPSGDSIRASNLYMLIRHLYGKRNNRGIVLATGTPVTNSMAEVYNLQRMMQGEALEAMGIDSFDAWAAVFGNIVSRMEYTHTGQVKNVSSFSQFGNLPELQATVLRDTSMFRADNSPTPVKRPKRKDAAVEVPETPGQAMWRRLTMLRVARMPKRPIAGEDRHILLSMDGALAAIDMRLVRSDAEDEPGSKLNRLVDNVLERYKAQPDRTQFVFSDIGVHANRWGFSAYDEIIRKLIAGGVPAEKIVDARRFDDSAAGKKYKAEAIDRMKEEGAIAIGSSDKLGTGVNAQKRAIAVHHLDAPYWPAALEQRNGRAYRQGNMLYDEGKPVEILSYVTENSADAWRWQLLARKTKFISDFMGGEKISRERHEDDVEELSPQQIMAIASGNPELLEKIQLDQDVKRLQEDLLFTQQSDLEARDRVRDLKQSIEFTQRQIAAEERQAERVKQLDPGGEFSMKVGDQVYDKRTEAGDALNAAFDKVGWGDKAKIIGEYRGLAIRAFRNGNSALISKDSDDIALDFAFGESALGTVSRIEHAWRASQNISSRMYDSLAEKQRLLAAAEKRAATPTEFSGEKDLREKSERLKVLNEKFADVAAKGQTPADIEKQAFEGLDESRHVELEQWFSQRLARIGHGDHAADGSPIPRAPEEPLYWMSMGEKDTFTPAKNAKPAVFPGFEDYAFFVSKNPEAHRLHAWAVREATTGTLVERAATRTEALDAARERLETMGADELNKALAAAKERYGESPYVEAKSALDKLAAGAEAVASAAKSRLKSQTPHRKRGGSSRLLSDIADLALYAAAKSVAAGARGASAINQIITDTIKTLRPNLIKHFRRVRDVTRAILDRAQVEGVTTPEAFDKIVKAVKKNPKQARLLLYTGIGDGIARMKAKLPAIKQAIRAAERAKRDNLEDIRKVLVEAIRSTLPPSIQGRFLAAVRSNVRTRKALIEALDRVRVTAAQYQAKAAWGSIREQVGPKPDKLKLTEARRQRLKAIKDQAKALRDQMRVKGAAQDVQRMEALAGQLADLEREVVEIFHQHETENVILVEGQIRSADAYRDQVLDRLRKTGKIKSDQSTPKAVQANPFRRTGRRMLTPESTAMTLDAEYGLDTAGPSHDLMVKAFWKGESAAHGLVQEMFEAALPIVKTLGFNSLGEAMAEISGTLGDASQRKIKVPLGGADSITLGQALDIYAKDDETREREEFQPYSFATRRQQQFTLTEADRDAVENALSDAEKRFVVQMKALFERFRPQLFKVHRRLKGWEPPKIDNYWPIKLNQEQGEGGTPESELWKDTLNRHLENAGYLKSREGAGPTPMLIGDFMQTWIGHIHSAANVIHMAEAIRAAEAVMLHPVIKSGIEERFGESAVERVQEIITDASFANPLPYTNFEKVFLWFTRNVSRAKVAINVRSWLKNVAGSVKVAAVVPAHVWAAGVAGALKPSVGKDMMQNCPFLWARYHYAPYAMFANIEQGIDGLVGTQATTAVKAMAGSLAHGHGREAFNNLRTLFDSVRVSLLADSVAARIAWAGYSAEAKRLGKDKAWVAWQVEQAIRRTQNTASPNDTSGVVAWARRRAFLAPLLAFTSDSTKSLNLYYQAVRSGDPKRISKTFAAITVNTGLSAGITGFFGYGLYSLLAALFGSDEWEKAEKWEKVKDRTAWAFARETMGIVLGADKVVEWVESISTKFNKGQRFASPASSTLMELVSAADDVVQAIDRMDQTPEEAKRRQLTSADLFWRALEKATMSSLDFSGLSVSPTYWLIKGAWPKGSEVGAELRATSDAIEKLADAATGEEKALRSRADKALAVIREVERGAKNGEFEPAESERFAADLTDYVMGRSAKRPALPKRTK